MAEISKIRCTQSGECYDIKDSVARASVSTLESNLSTLQVAVDNITGGGVDSYVTETELEAKNYVTTGELNQRGYARTTDLDNYLPKSEAQETYATNSSVTNLSQTVSIHSNRLTSLENKELKASVSDEILTLDFA